MLLKLTFILAAILFASSCASPADTAVAERQVIQFHQQFDAASYADIYEQSAPEFKAATTADKFVALLEAVHRKLGATKSSEKQNWLVNFYTSGTFVTLTYKTTFAEGDGIEKFVYKKEDNEAKLIGYNINSNVLILK